MKKRKKEASWWVFALTSVFCALSALIWAGRLRADMVSRGRTDGMYVLLVLMFLVDAVVFAVRAARTFRQQRSDKKLTEDNNITDGGTTHD